VAHTIRARLTLWYTAVLLAVLVLFGVWVYVVESRLRLGDIDAELRRAGTAVAAGIADELDEGASLAVAASEAYKDFVVPGRELAVLDGAGVPFEGTTLPSIEIDATPVADERVLTMTKQDREWRLSVQRRRHGGVSYQVIVAQPLAQVHAESSILRRVLLVGIPLALGLAAAGGWWIAHRALRPVSLMVGQAQHITGQTPGLRLRVPHPEDELGLLAAAFNSLLERLEGVLTAQRQFMADASHELRTPVSIVRTAAEVALSREARSEPEYRESLSVIRTQAQRLGQMVDDMMTLARADTAGMILEPRNLYLDEVLTECVRGAKLLGGERQVEVRAQSTSETPARGDEPLLRQMLMNLLDNAVRHTPPGGQVSACLTVTDRFYEISVSDTGSGVPLEDRDRIFERFVRLDPARSRPGGAGLGLPIARCIAEAHGGTLTLEGGGPSGCTFVVRLPVKPKD
jgi:heavy metal sensor kinase